MMKLLVLLTGLAMCQPAAAQDSSVNDSIRSQETRVQAAYDRYIDTCFELDDLTDMQRSEMQSKGEPPGCRDATAAYVGESDRLVRLIHGDPVIICTGANCPAEASDRSN